MPNTLAFTAQAASGLQLCSRAPCCVTMQLLLCWQCWHKAGVWLDSEDTRLCPGLPTPIGSTASPVPGSADVTQGRRQGQHRAKLPRTQG